MRVSRFLILPAFQILLLPAIYAQQTPSLSPTVQNYVALREVRECIESLGEMLAKVQPPVQA
jgi:hypothetical protein